jgi:hypothetical protein
MKVVKDVNGKTRVAKGDQSGLGGQFAPDVNKLANINGEVSDLMESFNKNERVIKNYDLNIWDKLGYETSYEQTGGWVISVYKIPHIGSAYGSGELMEDYGLELTPEEAQRLTLGVSEKDGGDYSEDDDFWLDADTFLTTYSDIPSRVKQHLNSLPPYISGMA